MPHNKIKDAFLSAVNSVTANPVQFAVDPTKDFSRQRKITPDTLISFLVSKGSSSARVEMLDFWGLDQKMPSLPALNQQRAKLRPEALEAVLAGFNDSVSRQAGFPATDDGYRYLAADGSTTTFFSSPKLAPPEYFCSPGHSASGVYSIHINAFFDLDAHIYTDAILQPVHEKNEFGAFCDIVDRHGTLPGRKNVYIGDRGYCSYNNMAHVVERGQYFLFRTKDIHSKGLVGNFEFPETESFDIDVAVTLTRSHSRKISIPPGTYRRFIDQASAFDFIGYGSLDTYTFAFRIVRFPIGDGSYECIVTNLPREGFPPERLKALYHRRWQIMPISALYPNKEYTLNYVVGGCMGNFVDWNSGECHFDTPEFVEMLEFCNTLPDGFDDLESYYEFYSSGKCFLYHPHLSTPWSMAEVRARFGDVELRWPGVPVTDGEKELGGGVAAPWGECFSICRNSSDPEGAWEFIKSYLMEDMQRNTRGNPLLRSVFEEKIQDALTVEYQTINGTEQEKVKYQVLLTEREGAVGFSCITEEDAELYRSIIENTHRSAGGDPGIMDIIMEEAGAYFGGDKDAATVADIIQNRVSMYVGERMK